MIFGLLLFLFRNPPDWLDRWSEVLHLGIYLWAWCGLSVSVAGLVYLPFRRRIGFQSTLAGAFIAELFTAPVAMMLLFGERLDGPPRYLLAAYVTGCALGLLLLLPISLPAHLPLRGKWRRRFLVAVSLPCLVYVHPWIVMLVRYGDPFRTPRWIEWLPTAAAVIVTLFYLWFAGHLLARQRTLRFKRTS